MARTGWRRIAEVLTYPLSFDDVAALVNPLASSRQLRAIVNGVTHESPTTATVTFRPGRGWRPHRAGEWTRVGVDIDGVRHYRSYSLTSAAGGAPSVTVTDIGLVSGWIVRHTRPGDVWYVDPPQGEFVLPDAPRPLLMLTAGNGITPVMSMLRTLAAARADADVVVLHSARTVDDILFADELAALDAAHPGVRVRVRLTATEGRLDLSGPAALDDVVPDWRARAAYACGPVGLLDDARALWRAEGVEAALTLERFAPPVAPDAAGEGGRVSFAASDREVDVDGATSLLAAGEAAGILMPSGCRMGICRTCLTPLLSGRVRDLVTGTVGGDEGELVRTCVSAPAGDVTILR